MTRGVKLTALSPAAATVGPGFDVFLILTLNQNPQQLLNMRAPTPCRSLDELPLEVKLRFVENCDLSALVKLHTLSKTWRALVAGDR